MHALWLTCACLLAMPGNVLLRWQYICCTKGLLRLRESELVRFPRPRPRPVLPLPRLDFLFSPFPSIDILFHPSLVCNFQPGFTDILAWNGLIREKGMSHLARQTTHTHDKKVVAA